MEPNTEYYSNWAGNEDGDWSQGSSDVIYYSTPQTCIITGNIWVLCGVRSEPSKSKPEEMRYGKSRGVYLKGEARGTCRGLQTPWSCKLAQGKKTDARFRPYSMAIIVYLVFRLPWAIRNMMCHWYDKLRDINASLWWTRTLHLLLLNAIFLKGTLALPIPIPSFPSCIFPGSRPFNHQLFLKINKRKYINLIITFSTNSKLNTRLLQKSITNAYCYAFWSANRSIFKYNSTRNQLVLVQRRSPTFK